MWCIRVVVFGGPGRPEGTINIIFIQFLHGPALSPGRSNLFDCSPNQATNNYVSPSRRSVKRLGQSRTTKNFVYILVLCVCVHWPHCSSFYGLFNKHATNRFAKTISRNNFRLCVSHSISCWWLWLLSYKVCLNSSAFRRLLIFRINNTFHHMCGHYGNGWRIKQRELLVSWKGISVKVKNDFIHGSLEKILSSWRTVPGN